METKKQYYKAFLKFKGTVGRERKEKFQSIELFKIDFEEANKDQVRAINEAITEARKTLKLQAKSFKDTRVHFEYFESEIFEGIDFETWHMFSNKSFAKNFEVES